MVGETLTATTQRIWDADGLTEVVYEYEWYRHYFATGLKDFIEGATGSTYTVTDAEACMGIVVDVIFTDDAGHRQRLSSFPVPVPPEGQADCPNNPATGGPDISGTAQVGETLTAGTRDIWDVDGMIGVDFAYQWVRHDFDTAVDTDIAGATGVSYTVTPDDEGKGIKVRVSFTDNEGFEESLTSDEVQAPGPEQPARADNGATGGPGITGTPQVGETLNATTQDIADEDGMTGAVFTHQWVRHDFGARTDTDIDGATGASYTVASGDAGQGIKVRVSFTDDAGNKETLTSYAVAASAPPLTAEFRDAPERHNGEDGFTFRLAFSEAISASNADVRDHVLKVTGGSVTVAKAVDVRKDLWKITARPDSRKDITLAVPMGRDCDETGAVCTKDGRSLSNRLELSVPGPDGQTTERPTNREEPKEPPAPQNLTAVMNKNGSVTLVWDAPDDDSVTGYRVLRRRPTMDEDTLLVHVEDTGSTATTYTDSEVTGGVRHVYRVKALNAAGLSEWSNHVNVDPPEREANAPATGAPAITGTTRVGETLTADTSGIADENGLDDVSFTYQWIAGGADIAAATGATYTLADTDEGKAIRVRVSFTDNAGNEETLTSGATATVAAATQPNNPATGAPTISGAAQVGETLTADTSGIADEDGLSNPTFKYEWLADDTAIQSARDGSYTLANADESKTVRVRVSFTDDEGNEETLTSAATDTVAAAAQPNNPATGAPAISGTAQVGETLTTDTSGIADEDGLDNAAFAYQWTDGGSDIEDATGTSYTLTGRDEGLTIQVRVSFTDDAGNPEALTSAPTDAVQPPPNSPTITGTVRVGETLTADTSGIRDEDGMENPAFGYQWIAGGADIEGATGASYTIIADDEGLIIQVWVSFTDDAGNYETRISDGTEAVAPGTPPNTPATGAPTITGTVRVGETLTADTSAIADADGMENAAFTYQWIAGGADIEGATGASYTIIADDEDLIIQVWVSFTDDAGNYETRISDGTEAVAPETPPNTPATGAPTITGTVRVGETLTADTSAIADADGMENAAFTYQWVAGGADIEGATGAGYTIIAEDEDLIIKVRVSFADDAGNEETLTSVATDAVAAEPSEPPDKPRGLEATATHDSVTLTWDDPGDDSITGYVILRRVRVNDQGGDFSELVADTGTAETTYTDDKVADGTTYTYRIKAINQHGVSERSRWFHIETPAPPVPDKPRGLEATASHGQVVLTWDDPQDDSITGYVILRRVRVDDEGGDFSELVADTGTAATTYTDDTVAASTTYTYRIKAINEAGPSERSRWFHIDTPAAP